NDALVQEAAVDVELALAARRPLDHHWNQLHAHAPNPTTRATRSTRGEWGSDSVEESMVPLNVPNALTVVRILLVPVLVVALLDKTTGGDVLAAIVFAIASLTDAIDGYLARSRNWVTTFGKLMDPIADKLLIVAALIALVSLSRLEAGVAMVIISREIAVTVLRAAAGAQGTVIAANSLGKLKTAMQVAMVMVLLAVGEKPLPVKLLVYATVVITVLSGLDYFFGLRREEQPSGIRATPGRDRP